MFGKKILEEDSATTIYYIETFQEIFNYWDLRLQSPFDD